MQWIMPHFVPEVALCPDPGFSLRPALLWYWSKVLLVLSLLLETIYLSLRRVKDVRKVTNSDATLEGMLYCSIPPYQKVCLGQFL